MSGRRYRIALIGVTGYAAIHLRALLSEAIRHRIEFRSAVVINPDEASEACTQLRDSGVRIYSSVDELWMGESGNIDLCIIPTGIASHCSMTLQALAAGAHVLLEKPAAACLKEVDAMMEAESKAGKMVAVGFQDIYRSSIQSAKRDLLEGAIGRVERIRSQCLWPRPCSYYQRNDWAGRLHTQSGAVLDSPVNNAMAHFINLGLYLSAGEQSDMARCQSIKANLYRVQDIESFDTVSFRAVLDAGVEFCFWGSHSSRSSVEPMILVEGSQGVLRWTQEAGVRIEVSGEPKRAYPPEPVFQTTLIIQSILDRMDGIDAPICSLRMARAHTELVLQLHEASTIQDVSASHIQTTEIDGEVFRNIPSLSGDTDHCFNRKLLYEEASLDWTERPSGCAQSGISRG